MIDSKTKKSLVEFLLSSELIDQDKLEQVERFSQSNNLSFEEALLEKEILHDEELGQIVADLNNWRFVNLAEETIDAKLLRIVPEEVARTQKIIAFKKDQQGVHVAMQNPNQLQILHLCAKLFQNQIVSHYATNEDLNDHFKLYKFDLEKQVNKLVREKRTEHNVENVEESNVVKILNRILENAVESGVSDIHIEPYEEETVVRFRIDGVMHEILKLPLKMHEVLITRIKVMARLRTDEHQIPQDGKIQYSLEKERLDVRVSIVPTTKGENSVLRILSQSARHYNLKDLGLRNKDLTKVEKQIKKPWGMILSTGPTGSGKTTSLYTILKMLNTKEVNIATIEDPVEYNIDGISQIQVNNKTNLTFASGLKSIVRQDPDIIMVGEIRDRETAEIAVNSAMTGHLVLSTLHTNDAATTLPRLSEMGVEPFLIASTVNIIVGQRLLRKVCPKCIRSYEVTNKNLSEKIPTEIQQNLFQGKNSLRLYKGSGCSLCNNTGYLGRTGVFEILEIDEIIRKLIVANASADEIRKQAIKNGMTTMLDDSLAKVMNGETTLEEAIRVVKI